MPANTNPKQRIRPDSRSGGNFLTICAAIALFLLILWFAWKFPAAELIENSRLAERIADLGWVGIPAFLVIGGLATAVGLPRQLFAFIGGYSFGMLGGVFLGTTAAITGCYLCFLASRYALREPVARHFARFVTVLNSFIHNDAFLKILVLRLQPFGTNLMTNLAAGVSKIPARVFISSSLIGYIPQMCVFALLGSGVRVHSTAQVTVSFILFLISFVIGWIVYKRHKVIVESDS